MAAHGAGSEKSGRERAGDSGCRVKKSNQGLDADRKEAAQRSITQRGGHSLQSPRW